MEEQLGDFDAARADILALVGLPPNLPHVPQNLPADVQQAWARLDESERELRERCTRCARCWLLGFWGLGFRAQACMGALGQEGTRTAGALRAVRSRWLVGRVLGFKAQAGVGALGQEGTRTAGALHAVRACWPAEQGTWIRGPAGMGAPVESEQFLG